MNFTPARRAFVELNCDPVALALQELRETPEAVALARIVQVAQPWAESKPVNFTLFDCGALAKDALDDMIFDAARSYDLDREELPSREVIVDRLVAL